MEPIVNGMGFDYAIFDELMEEHEAIMTETDYSGIDGGHVMRDYASEARAYEDAAFDRWVTSYLEREIEENKLVIHVGGE